MRLFYFLCLFSLPACFSVGTGPFTENKRTAGGIPTKDEVALVNQKPVSLANFMSLRSMMKTNDTHFVFQVLTAYFLAKDELFSLHASLPLDQLLLAVRFAYDDPAANPKTEILQEYLRVVKLPGSGENTSIQKALLSHLEGLRRSDAVIPNPHLLAHLR